MLSAVPLPQVQAEACISLQASWEWSLDCPNYIRRTKSSIKKRIIVHWSVWSIFGRTNIRPVKNGLNTVTNDQTEYECDEWPQFLFFFLMANVLSLTTDFCLRDKSDLKYCTEAVWGPKTLSCDIKHVFVTTTTDQILSLVNYCTWNERPHQLYFFKWCFPNCQLLSRKQCTL